MNTYWRYIIMWVLLCGSLMASWAGFPGGIVIRFYANNETSLSIPAAQSTTSITWRVEIDGSMGYPGDVTVQRSLDGMTGWTNVGTIHITNGAGQTNPPTSETNAYVPNPSGTYYFRVQAPLITPPGGTKESGNVVINVVAVDKIQYDNSGTWSDVPDPLCVAKGTAMTFKAVQTPAGASWPSGKPVWGGTSGASGTGTTKIVTFNTAGTFTVTAQCGNTKSVNVRVVEVQKIQYDSGGGTFVDTPDPLRVPKGATVTFKAIPNPAGSWPAGKPVWGGTSGATGTGETKTVTFNTVGTFTVTAECGNTVSINVAAVEVQKIQYDSGGGTFVDVPDPLRVPKGATVTFKAIPNPAGGWPAGKPVWGGTSGATGTGETKAVTFDTVGPYTVTAECSNTVTANIIVVEVQKIQYDSGGGTFVDTPDPLRVPKGATVTFKAIPNPAGGWPAGKPVWGGTSGATGTGETKAVTFDTVGPYTVTAECGNTVTANVVVVEVQKLQYNDGGGTFYDVSDPLRIPIGSTITFKAIPNPAGGWPTDKPVWGGTSGATGTGETKAVTFDTVGPYTVTAECGNTVTANIIVVEVQKIQYCPGGGVYLDTPDPLYVSKGSTITFRAVPNPAGGWPINKPVWGGTAGASGVADSKAITFNTVGPCTVTAECGNTVTVNVIVFEVIIEKCSDTWMPTKDNSTTITARFVPDTVTGTLKFTLFEVSAETGFCVNKGNATDSDLKLQNQAGFTISGNNTVATTDSNVNSIAVTVSSYDYGAYGKIKAEGTTTNWSAVAHVEGSTTEFVKIPLDEDGNDIADAWTHNTGGKDDDADVSLNNTHNGDGLTRYKEYRGVDIDNDNAIADAERLDPAKKDLFVQGKDFTGGDYTFTYGGAYAEAEIEVHTFVGTVGTDDRGIDVMIVSVLDQGGHISRAQDPVNNVRKWKWSTLGQSPYGTAAAYGTPGVNKKAFDFYYSDKPYIDGSTWTAASTWGAGPNGTFDALDKVEDTNDNGVLDAVEKDGNANPPPDDSDAAFDGDYPKISGTSWEWNHNFSPHDLDNDGSNEVPLGGANDYTKAHIIMHVITHEMGHGMGIHGPFAGHCDDDTCLMYQYSNNRSRQNHLCNDCRAMILIHNN